MQTEVLNSTEQDQQAVAAVCSGDAERYGELVERHQNRVYALAWSRLGDATMAEEATQEAFIRGYRRLWLLGDGAKFAAWINTIARRVSINFGLRYRRELAKRERWALEQPPLDANENPGADTDELGAAETLRQILAQLPDAHRECLVLFYLEGKSGAEAAAVLGISENAMHVRLHRARAALRERLEDRLAASLGQLRPARTLAPAVMSSVLASSGAKAAAAGGAGSATWGMLAKFGPIKGFFGFFPAFFLLPFILLNWLFMRLELENFRDRQGFRARLFRKSSLWLILWSGLVMMGIFTLLPLFQKAARLNTVYFLLTAVFLCQSAPALKRLVINRNKYFVFFALSAAMMAVACLLTGVGWMPLSWMMGVVVIQGLAHARYYGDRPMRMDYNLFLRATEGLLSRQSAALEKPSAAAPRRKEQLAFARFLGTRWLVTNYRWTEGGLRLPLPPAKSSLLGLMWNVLFWSPRSSLLLDGSGGVTANLEDKDRKALRSLQRENLPSSADQENLVATGVASAWGKFRDGDLAAAERLLGEVPEAEVFRKPRARTISTQVQRGLLIGSVLFIAAIWIFQARFFHSFMSLQQLSQQNLNLALSDLRHARNEAGRFHALGPAAKECCAAGKWAQARDYAEELAQLLPNYKDDGIYGNAVHDANLVLGRIAVRQGKLDLAGKYLIEAGKTPGSPNLDSFGPNMTLAKDLLEKGRKDVVLQYFTLCRKFWTYQPNPLDRWTREVQDGKIPDFGANLFY